MASERTNVVLPAPLGPRIATTWPLIGDEVEPGQGLDLAEALGQASASMIGRGRVVPHAPIVRSEVDTLWPLNYGIGPPIRRSSSAR